MDLATETPPAELAVTLRMDDALRSTLTRDETALASAEAYVIDCAEMAVEANNELRSVKGRIAKVKELRKGFLDPAQQIIARAEALFNPALTALQRAETHLKGALLAWSDKEEKRIADERRQREEEERKRRQKAEADAAAELARADELAAEERRRAHEAEQRRQQAVESGDARGAARAAAEAAKASERAEQVVENAASTASARIEAAQASVAPAPEMTKIAGFSKRKNWVAELAPGTTETQALAAIVAAIAAGRTDLIAYLKLDLGAASKTAKVQEALFNIPGLVAKDKPIGSSRSA